MLPMSHQQLTMVSRLSKTKNNPKRVIDHGGAFFICQEFNLGDLIGNEAADLKNRLVIIESNDD